MTALRDDRLALHPIDVPPQETTRVRRETEQLIGKKLPPGSAEIAAYQAAGLEPPTE